MNTAIIKRIVWKEARQIVPLWGCLVGFAFIFALLTAWDGTISQIRWNLHQSWEQLWVIGTFCGIILGLAGGAPLFAEEVDNRTADFLWCLGIERRQISVIKSLFVAASLVLVLSVIAGLIGVINFTRLTNGPDSLISELGVKTTNMLLGSLAMLGISCCTSMITKSTLHAAFASAVVFIAAFAICEVSAGFVAVAMSLDETLVLWAHGVFVVGLSAVVVLRLSSSWDQDADSFPSKRRWRKESTIVTGQRFEGNSNQLSDAFVDVGRQSVSNRFVLANIWPSQSSNWTQLFWQTFQNSRSILWVLLAVIAIPQALGLLRFVGLGGVVPSLGELFSVYTGFGLVLVTTVFTGVSVFGNDQRRQSYRFFQQHVVPPGRLWWSRILPLFFITSLLGLIWYFNDRTVVGIYDQSYLDFFVRSDSITDEVRNLANRYWGADLVELSRILLICTMVFSVSQFCSMLIRSNLVALFVALASSVLGVLILCIPFELNMSTPLFAVPLVFIPLVATRLIVSTWLQERLSALRIVLIVTAVLGVVGIQVLGMFAWRYNSRPAYLNSRQASEKYLDNYVWPQHESSAELAKACLEIKPDQDRDQFLKQNTNALVLVHKALDENLYNSGGLFLDAETVEERSRRGNAIIDLLLAEANSLTKQNQLEQAYDSYCLAFRVANGMPFELWDPLSKICFAMIEWGDAPGQKIELLRAIAKPLYNRSTEEILNECRWQIARLKTERAEDCYSYVIEPTRFRWDNVAERRRSQLVMLDCVENYWFVVSRLANLQHASYASDIDLADGLSAKLRLLSQSRFADLAEAEATSSHKFLLNRVVESIARNIQIQRYLEVRFALSAFRLEHGSLPKNLDEFRPRANVETLTGSVQDSGQISEAEMRRQLFFTNIPVDVVTGNPFCYEPNGIPARLTQCTEWGDQFDYQENTPFILPWSLTPGGWIMKTANRNYPEDVKMVWAFEAFPEDRNHRKFVRWLAPTWANWERYKLSPSTNIEKDKSDSDKVTDGN